MFGATGYGEVAYGEAADSTVTTNAQVTTVALEALAAGASNADVTTVALESLVTSPSNARATTIALEVLVAATITAVSVSDSGTFSITEGILISSGFRGWGIPYR